ncbi:S8 family serine peptidase [Massilia soli]|uniref:S8 family serine peptidase n=1 Tax=Massilia soli TaxID=2792854 RepID=A0ABS7SSM5_9BURK|nr:S8 family serine peptidase [Massilia soli]MBZ2208921.1 S8 family serine peptidase [Massilia soli]
MNQLLIGASTFTAAILALGVAGAGAARAAAPETTRVVVAFKPGAAAPVKAAVGAARGQVKRDLPGMNAIAVEIPARALRGLRNNPQIEFIEEDVKRYPLALAAPSNKPYLPGQLVPYGIRMVQADQLPDNYAANRMVCIIDSGYDRAHEDLAGNSASGVYDAGTGWWHTDENHHGTHVAGTVAAINNSGTGVVGVAPNRQLRLHIVKVFGAEGWAYSSTLAAAANQCGSAGANVISMSLGGARPSQLEIRAFMALASKGVLSVAAAGNDGNRAISYPAGYPSVVMVGALDQNKAWAAFSQFNSKVELSAPGVGVLSTVPMGGGAEASLTVGRSAYAPGTMAGSPFASASAPLADFGLGDAVDAALNGKVCLIARGSVDFATKVANCQRSGGVAAVVYNNVPGGFSGTLGATVTSIPSVSAADTEGAAMMGQLGQLATVAVKPVHYAYYDGTSMATPHVAAVAALVWSYFPSCTAAQLRSSLGKSAQDLGAPGRDERYGHGLVQAKAAYDRINTLGCGN